MSHVTSTSSNAGDDEEREKNLFIANCYKFVSQNAVSLVKLDQLESPKQLQSSSVAFMPPFNKFLHGFITHDKRVKFFMDIKPGDTVVGVVDRVVSSGIYISLLCVDLGFERDVSDQSLECFIGEEELQHTNDRYLIDALIRAIVLEVNVDRQEMTLGIKTNRSCSQDLGNVPHSQLPLYFRESESIKGRHYGKMLKKSATFRNPSSLGLLCNHFGINQRAVHSFYPEVKNADYSEETSAVYLRKHQSARLATKSVARGVERFRAGANAEALQHFNKALQVDPEHVEALVARGALYANNGSFKLAIEDFEKALQEDPESFNARKYLAETLKAHAQSLKEKGDKTLAERLRQKADDIANDLRKRRSSSLNDHLSDKVSVETKRFSLSSITGLLPKSFDGILTPELEAKLHAFYKEKGEAGEEPPDILAVIERLGGPSVSSLEEHLKKYYSQYKGQKRKNRRSSRHSTVSISSESSDSSTDTSPTPSDEKSGKKPRHSRDLPSNGHSQEKRKSVEVVESTSIETLRPTQITPIQPQYNQYRRTVSVDNNNRRCITSAADVNGKSAVPPAPAAVLTAADIQAQKKLKDMESFIKQLKMKPPKAGK